MHQQIKEIILSDSNSLYRVTSAFINYSDNIIEFDYKKYKHIYADEITGDLFSLQESYSFGIDLFVLKFYSYNRKSFQELFYVQPYTQ